MLREEENLREGLVKYWSKRVLSDPKDLDMI
jgi:hypothetical protein